MQFIKKTTFFKVVYTFAKKKPYFLFKTLVEINIYKVYKPYYLFLTDCK